MLTLSHDCSLSQGKENECITDIVRLKIIIKKYTSTCLPPRLLCSALNNHGLGLQDSLSQHSWNLQTRHCKYSLHSCEHWFIWKPKQTCYSVSQSDPMNLISRHLSQWLVFYTLVAWEASSIQKVFLTREDQNRVIRYDGAGNLVLL